LTTDNSLFGRGGSRSDVTGGSSSRRFLDSFSKRYFQAAPLLVAENAQVASVAESSPRQIQLAANASLQSGASTAAFANAQAAQDQGPDNGDIDDESGRLEGVHPEVLLLLPVRIVGGAIGTIIKGLTRLRFSLTVNTARTVEEVVASSRVLSKSSRLIQLERSGGLKEANRVFDSIARGVSQPVKTVQGSQGTVRVLDLPGGGTASLRSFSTKGRPTIEVTRPGEVQIRIRF
jgi:hypothetical protein